MLSRALTPRNLLFYAHLLFLIDQTLTFSLAHCPIYAGMFLFCAGSRLKKVNKKIERWVQPFSWINFDWIQIPIQCIIAVKMN